MTCAGVEMDTLVSDTSRFGAFVAPVELAHKTLQVANAPTEAGGDQISIELIRKEPNKETAVELVTVHIAPAAIRTLFVEIKVPVAAAVAVKRYLWLRLIFESI